MKSMNTVTGLCGYYTVYTIYTLIFKQFSMYLILPWGMRLPLLNIAIKNLETFFLAEHAQ